MYGIVVRYNDPELGLIVSQIKGPFESRKKAMDYNSGAFPSPEYNLVVPVHEPYLIL